MTIGAIELERPFALLLLALPIALLLLVRLRARPEEDATGTLEIWRRAALERPASASRARRRIPLAIWLLCASLVSAAIAIAGPRPIRDSQRSLLIIVDRSPSMYLRSGGLTRLDQVFSKMSFVSHHGFEHEPWTSVTWIAPPVEVNPVATKGQIPDEWRSPPRIPRPEPDLRAWDRPGCLLITDRQPEPFPDEAGVMAAGGDAVPGPVGVHDSQLVEWDGTRLIVSDRAAPARAVRIDAALAQPIARVAKAWAESRGFVIEELDDAAKTFVALELRAVDDSTAAPHGVDVGRDGWSSRGMIAGPAPTRDTDGPLETWLTDAAGATALVTAGPGRIAVAMRTFDAPAGDPAAFAVSWSQLLDAHALLPPDCVSLTERLSADGSMMQLPVYTRASDGKSSRWTAAVALAALALALLALSVRAPLRLETVEPARGSSAT